MMEDAVQSRAVYGSPGYRTLLGRVRDNVRRYIRKQLELPRQEIAEIVQANLRALKWFGLAALFAILFLVALVVFVVAVIAIVLPWPVAAFVVLLLAGVGAGLSAWTGYRRLELRGPTRSIESVKETVRWVRARLLGRSES